MRIRAGWFAVLLTALAAMLAPGCAGRGSTVRLGVNLELSGRLAWYGQATLSGVRLAANEINLAGGVNGKPVELVVLDNRSENAEAALAAIRLSQREGVKAMVGPSTSGGVKAALATESGVPVLVPSATADTLVPQSARQNEMIRLCYTDSMQGGALARFAGEQGYEQAAMLIESSSDYARGMAQAFERVFTENGGQISGTEYYSGGETDFGSVIARLKRLRFDALFVPAYYTEAALILRQLSQQGVSAVILSGDAFDAPALDELAGGPEIMNGIYYASHYAPGDARGEGFARRYAEQYGTQPPAYAALGYDCTMLFAQALAQTPDETPAQLLKQLARTEHYEGVTGGISIDASHNARKPVHIIQIQNGVRTGVGLIQPVDARRQKAQRERGAFAFVKAGGGNSEWHGLSN